MKARLSCTDIKTIPKKIVSMAHLFCMVVLLTRRSKYPTARLKQAQRTFTRGEDNPLPGGSEKGLGKGSPEMPFTKCGTKFARKAPAKKAAM